MKNSIYIGIILCICFGCKPKVSQTKTADGATQIQSTSSDSTTTELTSYFMANGTEPFWNLEIDDERIAFRTPTDSIKMQYVEPILAQDSNVKRYHIETESSMMTIQIAQTECTNAMSGKVSPYSVTIEYKKGAETEFHKLEGCGHYMTDYRLHDIWVLESLNGRTITKDDFGKEFPIMEVKAAENTFSGFAGCNRMNGTLFFEKGLLRFTNIATTRMMCEPSNKETEFLKALQSSTAYSIKNSRLTLSNPSGILTVFKKID